MRTREQVIDEMLVLAAQARQVEAFERLAKRWHPRLLRHAYRLTGDPEGARDAVQEAWVAIARGFHRLEDPARFGAWAIRITQRRCADWIAGRRRARNHSAALEAAAAGEVDGPVEDDAVARARDALRHLDPERRALMSMFYVEGLSVVEIAHVLEIPVGTVKSRLYTARERLRAILEV